MSDSALRWVGLALLSFGQPGLRRRVVGPPGEREELLPGGWDEAARAEIERARGLGATLLTLDEDGYPPLLRDSSDPPPALYLRGRLEPEDRLAVAVVGARRATPHGERFAGRLAEGLAQRGFTVVSGLARGIDAAAHRGALSAGGRTVAVLGCGIDRTYPGEHRALAREIAARGAVISELPIGAAPLKQNCPERNRIIAWMTWATVVVEAARDSGSLITARLAADEGRTVLAVPGAPGEPNAEGTNGLLRQGAACCRDAEDVVEDLAPQIASAAAAVAAARGAGAGPPGPKDAAGAVPEGGALSHDERRVLAALPATRSLDLEALAELSGLATGILLSVLLRLELRGLVRQIPGGRFLKEGGFRRPI